jgi:hypothetical protein
MKTLNLLHHPAKPVIFLTLFLIYVLASSCAPSPEEQATQTAQAQTATAAGWTATHTPRPTLTFTPSPTATAPIPTPEPTATLVPTETPTPEPTTAPEFIAWNAPDRTVENILKHNVIWFDPDHPDWTKLQQDLAKFQAASPKESDLADGHKIVKDFNIVSYYAGEKIILYDKPHNPDSPIPMNVAIMKNPTDPESQVVLISTVFETSQGKLPIVLAAEYPGIMLEGVDREHPAPSIEELIQWTLDPSKHEDISAFFILTGVFKNDAAITPWKIKFGTTTIDRIQQENPRMYTLIPKMWGGENGTDNLTSDEYIELKEYLHDYPVFISGLSLGRMQ